MEPSKQAPIYIFGDVMLDRYLFGNVERISPEAPVPVVHVQREDFRLGGAANVAHNIASLEGSCQLFGLAADDEAGKQLKTMVEKLGLAARWWDAGKPTISKTRIIAQKQQIVRLDFEETDGVASAALTAASFLQESLAGESVVVLSDYGKGLVNQQTAEKLINEAKGKEAKLIVDPKGADWSKYCGAFIITPNLKELSEAYGSPISNTDLAVAQAAEEVRKRHRFDYILVTRSAQGMSLVGENRVEHHPTRAKEVFDVSGAGDTVVAALALALARGTELEEAIDWANLAAGVVVGKIGTSVASLQELEKAKSKLA